MFRARYDDPPETRDEAEARAERIRSYWRERGHEIHVVVQEGGFHPSMRARRWDVRSNLVDGEPKKVAHSR